MSHVSYQAPGPTVEMDADYVVVGSGAGGATAAVSLAREGASVVVVEVPVNFHLIVGVGVFHL